MLAYQWGYKYLSKWIIMNNKVFVSCAVTGSGDTAKKHPDLPKTPEQIAKAAIEDRNGKGLGSTKW